MTLTPMSEELVADVHDYSRIMKRRPERGAAMLASLGDRFKTEFGISENHVDECFQKYKGRRIQDMPDASVLSLHVCQTYRAALELNAYTRQEWTNDLALDVALSDDLLDTFTKKGKADGASIGEVLAGRICLGLQFMTRTSQYRDELDRISNLQKDTAGLEQAESSSRVIDWRNSSLTPPPIGEQAESISRVIDWADKKVIDPVFDMFDGSVQFG